MLTEDHCVEHSLPDGRTPALRTMAQEFDQQFVEYVIKSIVNNPDAVQVARTVDELGVLLSVKVDPKDMGLLIGRSGSTAKAIRVLARIVGMRNNARVNLRIEEPEGGKMSGGQNMPADPADIISELGMS